MLMFWNLWVLTRPLGIIFMRDFLIRHPVFPQFSRQLTRLRYTQYVFALFFVGCKWSAVWHTGAAGVLNLVVSIGFKRFLMVLCLGSKNIILFKSKCSMYIRNHLHTYQFSTVFFTFPVCLRRLLILYVLFDFLLYTHSKISSVQ